MKTFSINIQTGQNALKYRLMTIETPYMLISTISYSALTLSGHWILSIASSISTSISASAVLDVTLEGELSRCAWYVEALLRNRAIESPPMGVWVFVSTGLLSADGELCCEGCGVIFCRGWKNLSNVCCLGSGSRTEEGGGLAVVSSADMDSVDDEGVDGWWDCGCCWAENSHLSVLSDVVNVE